MRTVGILVFDDVEVGDFFEAVALFSAAQYPIGDLPALFRTLLLAQTRGSVTCEGGFQLRPQATISDHPPLDFLLVPGGLGRSGDWPQSRIVEFVDVLLRPERMGVRRQRQNEKLLAWLNDQSRSVGTIIGVGSGTVLLAECGLLHGCYATTTPVLLSWMRRRHPEVLLRPEDPFVDAGQVITVRNADSVFEATLYAIALTCGVRAALSVASRADRYATSLHLLSAAGAHANGSQSSAPPRRPVG